MKGNRHGIRRRDDFDKIQPAVFVQIDFRHNAQHVSNLVRQIVHQLFVISYANGFAVVVFADEDRSAARVGETADPF